MDIKDNYPLRDLTSFNIGGPAKFFVEVAKKEDLPEIFNYAKDKNLEVLVLGGGSNILVSDEGFDGLVIHINNKGFTLRQAQGDNDSVTVKVGSGEVWDEVVGRVVEQDLWGIENLSLIPGFAGAAPVQNIGAYGQEIAGAVESVEVYDRESGEFITLSNDECSFAYRRSIFNSSDKGRYIILHTTLKLNRQGKPRIIYPDVKGYFYEQAIESPTLQQMRQAIVAIRTRKHYDPKTVGNAGSFFKNPYLEEEEYERLEEKIKENFDAGIVGKLRSLKEKFRSERGIKIPAAFLIDICNLKGEAQGGAQISDKQPLIIINSSGDAHAADVLGVFRQVRAGVYDKTGIELANEPTPVGFAEKDLDKYFKLD